MSPILRGLATAALLFATGCASTPPASSPAKTPEPQAQAPSDQPVTIAPKAAPSRLEPIYFDTDTALLRPDAREALKRYAGQILANPGWGTLDIDGHCDERGSEEYNLALGKRRAEMVRRYLIDLGVPASRLDTRSFGEQKPAVVGHAESAWRYNRRSEIRSEKLHSATR